MASIAFEQATRYHNGAGRPTVDRLDLTVADGEFLVLVGPSGCGKSTTLRMLAGLEPVDAGAIRIGERDVTATDPRHRDVALVFQSYALYPHLTVADNIGFPLRVARLPKHEIAARVRDAARTLDLEACLDRKPKALSGGQRQRVAMGRAIVRRPQVFLMDEPLSNLDAALRVRTRSQIAQLQRRLATTTVYVTHDQVEAMTMGDRVAVLRDGILQQCAPPRELYRNPANAFVAGFLGSPAMNLFTRPVHDGHVTVGEWRIPVPRAVAAHCDGTITVGIRPEHLEPATSGLSMDIDLVEELGCDAHAYGRLAGEQNQPIVARTDWSDPPAAGLRIHLRPCPGHVHFFAADSPGRLLGKD
ncbi:MAG: sn-glycerol-3-phosphate ABC transporter ATP-binding protein UgpC [Mycobacteriaceae bacterium]|nr:sn-glycerol-3-phosphate ABC transporter ATP-binding protein UgpC [Mycobacteriaceae bacterium]